MSYRLQFDEELEEGLPRIAIEQMDRAIAELEGEAEDRAEAVHQLRKRCKKIRGLVRLFRGSLGDIYSQENAWFRDLARRFSGARDAEAMLECLDKLCNSFSEDLGSDPFATVRHALIERKSEVKEDADLPERMLDAVAGLRDAHARVLGWHLDSDGFAAVEGGLSRTYRRARKAMHAAYDAPSPERFHEWRKRVKYHWYHLRLLRDVWPVPMKALAAETKQLADLLGDDHDLAVLQDTLLEDHPGNRVEIEALLKLAQKRQAQFKAAAQTQGWRLFTAKPKVLCGQLSACWQAVECEASRAVGVSGEDTAPC